MKKLLQKFRPTKENIENLGSDKIEWRLLFYKILISLIGVSIILGFLFVTDPGVVKQFLAIDQAPSVKIWLISVGHLAVLTAASYTLFLCVFVGIVKIVLKFTNYDFAFKKLSNIYIFSDLIVTVFYWLIFWVVITVALTFIPRFGVGSTGKVASTIRTWLSVLSKGGFLVLYIYMVSKIKDGKVRSN